MAIDNTKLDYSSLWDIDKIIDFRTRTTSVASGSFSSVNIPHTYGYRPYIIAQYKPSTQSVWFESGQNLLGSSSQLVTMNTWVSNTFIVFFLDNDHGGLVDVDIRYWVLSDGN